MRFGNYSRFGSPVNNQYIPISGNGTNSVESTMQDIIPINATIKRVRWELFTAPGAGKSRTLVARVNGVSSALTMTIADTATSATSTTAVSFSPGDLASFLHTMSGIPASSGSYLVVEWETDNHNQSFMVGNTGSTQVGSSTWYFPLTGVQLVADTVEYNTELIVPGGFTLKNMYARVTTGAGFGQTKSFTIRKNGADTSITKTASGGAAQTVSDTTNSVAVVAGDTINMKIVGSIAANNSSHRFSLGMTADRQGEFIIGNAVRANFGTPGPEYHVAHGALPVYTSTESDHQQRVDKRLLIKKMFSESSAVPDNLATLRIRLRKNGADTPLQADIINPNSTGNDTGNVYFNDGDLMSVRLEQSGGIPITPIMHSSFLATLLLIKDPIITNNMMSKAR